MVVESLSSYLDGSLFEHEISSIDGHLVNCHECSAVHSDLAQIRMTARSLPQFEPPSHIWYQIKERVAFESPSIPESEQAPRKNWWQRMMSARYTMTLPQMAGAAAMTLLVAFGTGIVSRHNPRRDGGSAEAPQGPDIATMSFELPFKQEIDRQLDSINVQKASWDPQVREGFDQRLLKINDSIRSCRLNLRDNPSDADTTRQLMISLYEEERHFLEDVERMK